MILRTAAFVFLLASPLVAAAGNQQLTAYSDASYPQEWRILHDYWFNATSFLEDSRTFHVRMAIPAAGEYVWTMPETGGVEPGLANPLADLFTSLRISLQGNTTTWDLAKANTTTPFHADGVHDLLFTFTYRIKNLSPYEYSSILDETRQVRQAERRQWPDGNIVSRPNEASGFIRLQQVSSDSRPDACEETCAGFTNLMARDFNLVFNLRGHAFQLVFRQATEITFTQPDPLTYLVPGSSYSANAEFDATITPLGNLTSHAVDVLLDDPSQPAIAQVHGKPVSVKLPAGDHRFYYRIHLGHADETVAGAMAIRSPRSPTGIVDTIHVSPAAEHDPPWLLLALAVLGAILAVAAWRRRRFTWYEYQRGQLYLVVDNRGREPAREHRGRAPLLARIRQPRQS